MGQLEGKVAIVTGGGWNIGRAITRTFAHAGANVVICGRREEPLNETVELTRNAGGTVLPVKGDVTHMDDMLNVVQQARAEFGGVDIVCAIAGGGGGYEAVDIIDPAWWRHVIDINVLGTFHAVRAALPSLRERGKGSIITCSGGGAYFPMMGMHATAYATAKAGVCRFTDQLAVELLDAGIRVNCLQPGLTWSAEKLRAIEAEEAKTGQPHPDRDQNHPPEDAANLALWLASDESAPLTGRLVSVDENWWRDRAHVEAVCQSLHAYCLRRVGLEGMPS